MTTLLIDGDVIAYKIAASIERPTDWGEGLWTLHSNADEGTALLEGQIARLREQFDADDVIVALTDQEANWRLNVWPTYKANRKNTRRPLTLGPMRQHILDTHRTFLRPNLEGDDVLGILATHPKIVPGRKIIVSADKDFYTIPGEFYRMAGDDPELVEVTPERALYAHMYQTLMGDSTDGYPGCPGVGPKKAADILEKAGDDPRTMWLAVVEAYRKAKLTETDALVQARVARILHHQDYDFSNKKPILWEPPKA